MNPKKRVLIACEESQAVCIAFRELGFEAYSCDILPCSGNHPEWHVQSDITPIINGCFFNTEDGNLHDVFKWDAIIAFPPCTHLAASGAPSWKQKQLDGRQSEGIDFFMAIANNSCNYIAIENPTGIMSKKFRKPDQIINPYQFGDPYRKRTCLWLKGFPLLLETNIVNPIASWHSGSTRGGIKKDGTRTQSKLPSLHSGSYKRSKTFPGIAKAMAEQWGACL